MWSWLPLLASAFASIPTPVIDVSGTCPGDVTVVVTGGSPQGKFLLGWSETLSPSTIPSGSCAGVELDLGELREYDGKYVFSAGGTFTLPVKGRDGLCGAYLQVVDMKGCAVSEPVRLPGGAQSPVGYVGPYAVDSGPLWTSDPVVYNCLEACASIYGGTFKDYACSTSDQAVDHQAYVSGYGDDAFCTESVGEDFSVGTTYHCGAFGCAYSALVDDQCGSDVVNHCWLQ